MKPLSGLVVAYNSIRKYEQAEAAEMTRDSMVRMTSVFKEANFRLRVVTLKTR
jgi:hypothetical protein